MIVKQAIHLAWLFERILNSEVLWTFVALNWWFVIYRDVRVLPLCFLRGERWRRMISLPFLPTLDWWTCVLQWYKKLSYQHRIRHRNLFGRFHRKSVIENVTLKIANDRLGLLGKFFECKARVSILGLQFFLILI